MKFIFSLIFTIVIFSSFVSSYGLTPAQNIINYAPGSTATGSFEIINSEHKNFQIAITSQGELKDSVSFSQSSFKILSTLNSQSIDYKINIPTGLTPGNHVVELLILEIPGEESNNGAFVGAVVGIIFRIVVEVPYPGKYAESALSIFEEENKINFIIPVVSKGDLDIVRAKAIIEVYTPLNEKILTLNTNEISVASRQRGEVAAVWDTAGVNPGKYRVVASLIYDESTIILEKEFTIGTQPLVLKTVEVNDFSLGEIAKFEFLLENTWNDLISGAYIQMQIFNSENNVLADFKSATYDINSFENKLLVAFWDTDGVKKGSYPAKAFVKFGDQSIQHEFTLEVSDNQIQIIGVGYVIKSSGSSKGSGSLIVILSVAVGILILLNMIWFLILRKKLSAKAGK